MRRLSALLIAPPLVERTYPGRAMALDYLAAILAARGWDIKILDVDVEGQERFAEALQVGSFDLVGITAMSIEVDQANHLARVVRELAPKALLIRGGAHDTHAHRESCETHQGLYDALVIGEGEDTLSDIAAAVTRGSFLEERHTIPGLAFWDGVAKFTGHRPPTDVDAWEPSRLRHDPSYNFGVFGFRKTAQVMATRGCNDSCFYCSESVNVYRRSECRRNIASLRQEFAALKRAGYEAVYFDDPTFTRDRRWLLELCDEIRTFGFVWGCNTRVDHLDEVLVVRMCGAGCVYLFCGFESAVPEVLLAMNKTRNPSEYLEAAARSYATMRKNGLPCSAFLVFGSPRRVRDNGHPAYVPETDADVRESLRFAVWELNPTYLSMNILRLLPGIPFSLAPAFACIRPTGTAPVHGGHYDREWYRQNGTEDLRSTHPIFRAFEGCQSVNPPHMTPCRCYEILCLAVDSVNRKNAVAGKQQTQIVVDPRFSRFLKESWVRGCRRYSVASLAEIERSSEEPARQLDRVPFPASVLD